uniref:hypothetical protein n=1 Tax=Staphylococcus aureus TaxID=1280 RepID=UPI00301D58D0
SEEYEQEQEMQDLLSEEIDNLCSRIASNRNPFTKTVLERELRVKLAKLQLDTSQATTVGELQELIRNEKLQSRYLR